MKNIAISIALLLAAAAATDAGLKVEDVPVFQLRGRVTSVGGKRATDEKFSFRFSVSPQTVTSGGPEWSDWLRFGKSEVEKTLKGYPAIYMRGFPVVVKLQVTGVVDPTLIDAELRFDETAGVTTLKGELFGPSLGILLWRDKDDKPLAATMADYNRRYWKVLEGVRVPESQRPKKFPIVDRFIGGDNDRRDWREGIKQLSRAGFSVIMLPPSRPIRDLLLEAGLRRTAWAVYNPPGYAFDFDPKVTPEAIDAWAQNQAKRYLDAGYASEDMAIFAMSDEPGWYFPAMFGRLLKNPTSLARFRDYLKSQGLEPSRLGAATWNDVAPIGRSQPKDLPSRRLFYWTMRFFSWDSARHFAVCTRALEKAFYENMPILTNWNFFSGRFYVPGPVANNRDKDSRDAAMGGHDWLEFGKMRGCTMLWTEDWFADRMAYQWSFYCSKLRCAASKGGVQFGAYVIPRTAGDRKDGILQKILCVIGSGGKAIKYFVFGPEYNFPGNCYSERAGVLRKMAEAHRMIGAAEDFLWEGKRPRPEVAILMPRSAQVWDAKDIPVPNQIRDATNTNLNKATVDYMAEVFDLYLALQHANIPVDFLDEDDLTSQGLKAYRALYITAPNIPAGGQRGVVDWLRAGGVLVSVSGAGARDRYDEPCEILSDATGILEQPRERRLVADVKTLKVVGRVKGRRGEFHAVGVKGVVSRQGGDVLATFEDGSPAVVQRKVGQGVLVHFAFFPGMSYFRSSSATKDGLPVGFSEAIRDWIVHPVRLAKVETPVVVSEPLVEAPLLLSPRGAAVTLLNWTGESLERVDVAVRLPFAVEGAVSVERGELIVQKSGDRIKVSLPLRAADIVTLKAKGR